MKLRNRLTSSLAIAATMTLLAGCSNPISSDTGGSSGSGEGSKTIIVSSANFTESEIIGNIYAEALKNAGFDVETKFNVGSREAYVPALEDGSIDLIPDYTGNLLTFLDAKAPLDSHEVIEEQISPLLAKRGLTALTTAEAEDTDTVTVTAETAKKWNLKEIGDLAAHNAELVMGGNPEFNERERGIPGLGERYGVFPAQFIPLSDGSGPATVKALIDGKILAANIFTTSPAIPKNNFVVLEDPKGNFPSQRIVPLMNTKKASDEVRTVIDAVSAKLTTNELLGLNVMVSGDEKVEPGAAASKWLKAQGLA